MKLLFITREGKSLAGARVRCYNFSAKLQKLGVDTQVLSFADSFGAYDGAEESKMSFFSKVMFNRQAFLELVEEKDTIFCIHRFNYHAFAPWLASLVNNNRLILDLDDWEMREDPAYFLGFYPTSKAHFFTRRVAKRSVFCVAASKFLEDFLRPFNDNVLYIPTGVDTDIFKPVSSRPQDNEVVLSWIGTLNRKEYVENINLALLSFAELRGKHKNIYFEILGDGTHRPELEKLVASFKDDHVRLKSWIAPEGIPAYLESIDIGLLPVVFGSKFNRAKSPTKLFEYMAMEKPVVSSNIGEAGYIIKDARNGFLAEDRRAFTEKLEALIVNPGIRRSMGESARKDVEEQYSLDVCSRRLYDAVLALK